MLNLKKATASDGYLKRFLGDSVGIMKERIGVATIISGKSCTTVKVMCSCMRNIIGMIMSGGG